METGIKIQTTIEPETMEATAKAIVSLLEARADQETIRHAITALTRTIQPPPVNLQGVNFVGDRRFTLNVDADGGTSADSAAPSTTMIEEGIAAVAKARFGSP